MITRSPLAARATSSTCSAGSPSPCDEDHVGQRRDSRLHAAPVNRPAPKPRRGSAATHVRRGDPPTEPQWPTSAMRRAGGRGGAPRTLRGSRGRHRRGQASAGSRALDDLVQRASNGGGAATLCCANRSSAASMKRLSSCTARAPLQGRSELPRKHARPWRRARCWQRPPLPQPERDTAALTAVDADDDRLEQRGRCHGDERACRRRLESTWRVTPSRDGYCSTRSRSATMACWAA
jgi:hypothetical protein